MVEIWLAKARKMFESIIDVSNQPDLVRHMALTGLLDVIEAKKELCDRVAPIETNLLCVGCGEPIRLDQPTEASGAFSPAGTLVREWRHRDCSQHVPTVQGLMAAASEAEERGLVDPGEA